jgi:uncharacterized protein YndB with AHSA1/START domain
VYPGFIKATPQAIWGAITEPSWNSRYRYGGEGTFELRPGGGNRCVATAEMQAAGMPEWRSPAMSSTRHGSWCRRGRRA